MTKSSFLTTLSSEMLVFENVELRKCGYFSLEKDRKDDEIARTVSRESSDEETCAPRPSRSPILRLKRVTSDIGGGSRPVVFGPVGPPKVL